MSKLLQALDRAIQTDFEGVKDAVMDKTYMGQLVAVQHQRGAMGGQTFADLLGLNLAAHKKGVHGLEPPRPSQISQKRPDIIIPPRSTAMIPPGHVKNTLLHLFDVGSPSRMTLKEKRDTFRTLQKYLTAEIGSNTPSRPMLDATVKALEAVAVKASDRGEAFVTSMLQHTCFSASLIRLLTSALSRPNLEDLPAASTMAEVANAILAPVNSKKKAIFKNSPIWKLLEDFLDKPVTRRKIKEKVTLEKSIKAKVEAALKKKDTKSLVKTMADMLLKEDDSDRLKSGIIIDWLQKIDPELKEVDLEMRQKLLFNRNPHLLTIFSHLADWPHLKATIDGILSVSNVEDFEAKSVLDFLSTCIFLKMQWQCNDKHKPKHDSGPQDELTLSEDQVEAILNYVLCEADQPELDNEEQRIAVLKSRIPLIVSCLNTQEKSRKALEYLQGEYLLCPHNFS